VRPLFSPTKCCKRRTCKCDLRGKGADCFQLPAADEGVDEHEADLRRRPAHVDGADDVTALPDAAAKVASHVPRFQRHLVTTFLV
jgi:hypothetical protein